MAYAKTQLEGLNGILESFHRTTVSLLDISRSILRVDSLRQVTEFDKYDTGVTTYNKMKRVLDALVL